MKRILSLDGGGIRGHFTLQILQRVEDLLRKRDYGGSETFRLRDHYDLIAGTSTGAIIGTFLALGLSVKEIRELYREHSPRLFQPRLLPGFADGTFRDAIDDVVRQIIAERTGETLATLGSPALRPGGLMVVTMRRDTLSAWPVTNHPNAKYNALTRPDCNLKLPLWQLVCASAAAPPYFRAQEVILDPAKPPVPFLDGGLSGYNNPAALAIRMATLPPYHFQWPLGEENLHVLSVGTSDPDSHKSLANGRWLGIPLPDATRQWIIDNIEIVKNTDRVVDSLIAASTADQDIVCRTFGKTLYGPCLDRELYSAGSEDRSDVEREFSDRPADQELALREDVRGPFPAAYTYTRYQKVFTHAELQAYAMAGKTFWITDVAAMDDLIRIGEEYAEAKVKTEHLR